MVRQATYLEAMAETKFRGDILRRRVCKLLRRMPFSEIESEFQRIVDSSKTDCRWVKNQWCIPKFKGLRRLTGHATEQRSKTARTAPVESVEELRNLQSSGSRRLQEFASATPETKVLQNVLPGVTFMAKETDQPRARSCTDVMGMACQRGVHWILPLFFGKDTSQLGGLLLGGLLLGGLFLMALFLGGLFLGGDCF